MDKQLVHYWIGDDKIGEDSRIPEYFSDLLGPEGCAIFEKGRYQLIGQPLCAANLEVNEDWIKEVKRLIQFNDPRPSLYIMHVGQDDIRRDISYTKLAELIQAYEEIFRTINRTPNATMVVIEPIQCPEYVWTERQQNFINQIGPLLQLEVKRFKDGAFAKIKFVNLYQEGGAWRSNSKENFVDKWELNDEGRRKLAKLIYEAYMSFHPAVSNVELNERVVNRAISRAAPD